MTTKQILPPGIEGQQLPCRAFPQRAFTQSEVVKLIWDLADAFAKDLADELATTDEDTEPHFDPAWTAESFLKERGLA